MNEQTPEQLAKLPKWAQEKIRVLEMRLRERDEDLDALRNNKPSDFYYEPEIAGGPKVYVPAYSITCVKSGVILEISPRTNSSGIDLRWGTEKHGEVAFIPRSWQQACLVSKENMR